MAQREYQTFEAFWPFYLREHGKKLTRALHYIGTGLSLVFLALFGATMDPLYLLGMPLSGYFFAWVAHFTVEHNRPATFTYPLWSLIADYRMFFLFVAGRLAPELRRAGVEG